MAHFVQDVVFFQGSPGSPMLTGFAHDHRARHMADVIKIVPNRLEYWASRFQTNGGLTDTDDKNLGDGMVQQLQFIPRIPIELQLDWAAFYRGPQPHLEH